MASRKLELTLEVVQSFRVGRVIRTHSQSVQSLDYNSAGTLLASTSGADAFVVTDAQTGMQRQRIDVRKHGAGVCRFTADVAQYGSLVVASTTAAGENAIRAVDVARGEYVRVFRGHTSTVRSLDTSPLGPMFISSTGAGGAGGKGNGTSAGVDKTMLVWDVREQAAVGRLTASGPATVAFDPRGIIFGVCAMDGMRTIVKLYDCKKYQQGPFVDFTVENVNQVQPSCFRFSSDGEYFLLIFPDVERPQIKVYDAYKGNLYRTYEGHRSAQDGAGGTSQEAAFSADSKCVLAGSADGSVHAWELVNNKHIHQTEVAHPNPIGAIAINPHYAQFATACQNIAVWVPDKQIAEKALGY